MSAATREPGPAGAAYGPDSSFRTPILTTPSEICAWAGGPARLSTANSAAELTTREASPIAMTIVELQRERGYAATAGRGSIAGAGLSRPDSGPARLEDGPRISHEHLLDVVFLDARLAERRQDVVGDVRVMPLRPGPLLGLFGEHVRPAVGVVREDHLTGVALGAEPGNHLDTLAGRQEALQAEAVHPDRAPALHQAAQIAEVLAVAAVADDDAAEIDAFLREDRLLQLARASGGPGVRGDGHAGSLLGPRRRAQDVVDHRRDAGSVGGALDDGRLDAAHADALRDVADEQVGHRVDAVHIEIAL